MQFYSRVNIGTSTAGFASRNIKKGEEITDCYSWAYDITKFEDRLVLQTDFLKLHLNHLVFKYLCLRNPDLLKKYKFQCICVACKEEWLTFHDLPRLQLFSLS